MVDRILTLLGVSADYEFIGVLVVSVLFLMLGLILVNSLMAMIYTICRLD